MNNRFFKKHNVRDFSEYTNKEGKKLAENICFRSCLLEKFSQKEIAYLKNSKLATVIDLRNEKEVEEKPDPLMKGVTSYHYSLIEGSEFGISKEEAAKIDINDVTTYSLIPDMRDVYKKIVLSHAATEGLKESLALIFDEKREGAILWHCTQGKDRCGLLSVAFMTALGYDEQTIIEDYVKSDAYTKGKGKKYYWLIRIFKRNKKLAHMAEGCYRADRAYIEAAFEAVKEKYGSIEMFVEKELALDKKKVETFKKKYMR